MLWQIFGGIQSLLPEKLRRPVAYVIATLGYTGLVFYEAKAAAKEAGKPLLNAGCKSIFTEASDVNLDIVPRAVPRFTLGDIQDLKMFRDKQFGAVFASHVLEHVEDPDAAFLELQRVADRVFIITPLLIWPWSWLHPGHRWVMWGTKRICRLPQSKKGVLRKFILTNGRKMTS